MFFNNLKFDEGCWNSQMILVNFKGSDYLPVVAKWMAK